MSSVLAIINPVAGRGRAELRWRELRAAASDTALLDYRTTGPGDAARRAAEWARSAGAGPIIVIGGDGTVHETVNGLHSAGNLLPIAVLPAGTGNDFVLFSDPEGDVQLTPTQIAAVCDRHFGVGGDGLIRAVRSERLVDGAAAIAEDPDATWFMDYWNADGSPSEMCGNGIRVFTRYLIDQGLIELGDGEWIAIGTRAGVRRVRGLGNGNFEADLGVWRLDGGEPLVRAKNLHAANDRLSAITHADGLNGAMQSDKTARTTGVVGLAGSLEIQMIRNAAGRDGANGAEPNDPIELRHVLRVA